MEVNKLIGLISIVILAMVVLMALIMVAVWKQKKPISSQETDYQAFFIMGISFIGLGTALSTTINFGFLGFLGLGFVYMAIGWVNKDKWKNKKN